MTKNGSREEPRVKIAQASCTRGILKQNEKQAETFAETLAKTETLAETLAKTETLAETLAKIDTLAETLTKTQFPPRLQRQSMGLLASTRVQLTTIL